MNNKIKPASDTEASSGPSVLSVMSPDETKIQFEQLKRSARVTKTLLYVIRDCKKVLHKVSAPFLEKASDQDSQKKISARNNRQRDAVFLAAKDVLTPDHQAKKSIEESLRVMDDLDALIISNAREIKEKIVEKLDELIDHALKEFEKQPSAEFVGHFAKTAQDLNREIDLRLKETAQLHRIFKAQLRQAWIHRLITIRNMMIVVSILAIDAIATVGYMIMTQEKAPEPDIDTPSAIKKEIPLKKATSARPDKTTTSSKTVLDPATTGPLQKKVHGSAPVAASTQDTPSNSNTKAINGNLTLSSGQDPETMKKNVHALRDAIRAWNEESATQRSPEKEKGK